MKNELAMCVFIFILIVKVISSEVKDYISKHVG